MLSIQHALRGDSTQPLPKEMEIDSVRVAPSGPHFQKLVKSGVSGLDMVRREPGGGEMMRAKGVDTPCDGSGTLITSGHTTQRRF